MSGGLHSLATIIKRLEAATSRLEDVADLHDKNKPRIGSTDSSAEYPSNALPAPATSVSSSPSSQPPVTATAAAGDLKAVVAFDQRIIEGHVKPFIELTKSFASPPVIEMSTMVEKQFNDLHEFIHLSSSCQKPEQKTIDTLLDPLQAGIETIARTKEANRKERDWFTHLAVLGEAAPQVGWVISPKPGPYIGDIKDSVAYYGTKVMQEFKSKDPKHVEWVKSFIALLDECKKYVMEYHTTGLAWNAKGITVEEYLSKSKGPPASLPPPPPPPPLPPTSSVAVAPQPGAGGVSAVFAELNRGEEVTKNLRKVDKSEMTHKNPALRESSFVPSSPTQKKPTKPTKPHSLAGKKPSKFALEGNKWAIEYQENERSLTVEDTGINQAVNIYGCKNSTIVIKGKVNAVTITNCQNTSVLVESVVSAISVTRAPSFAVQITGSAPMLQIDSTDSGQIYLSKDSLGIEITTAKCSAINVSLPVEGEEDGVFDEQAVPEMLRTTIREGKIVTAVVEHVG